MSIALPLGGQTTLDDLTEWHCFGIELETLAHNETENEMALRTVLWKWDDIIEERSVARWNLENVKATSGNVGPEDVH